MKDEARLSLDQDTGTTNFKDADSTGADSKKPGAQDG